MFSLGFMIPYLISACCGGGRTPPGVGIGLSASHAGRGSTCSWQQQKKGHFIQCSVNKKNSQ